jgi:hypothetical protein
MTQKQSVSEIRNYLHKLELDPKSKEYFQNFPLNRFWASENMKLMQNIIRESVSLQEVIHSADKSFLFSVNENTLPNKLAVEWQIRNMKIDLTQLDIEESENSFKENTVSLSNRKLTPDFLRCLAISESIIKKMSANEPVILEIGGGLGHLARIMALRTNSKNYVIVDIAETLAFSYAFLSLNFDSDSVHLYDPMTSSKSDLSKFEFILCPVQYFEEFPIKKFDLCINTASIGEMHRKTQNYWFSQIQDKLEIKYFYSLNRFLNSIKIPEHYWRLEENEANTGWDKHWNILSWQLEPDFTRNPYVDTQIARYLEVFALKRSRDEINPGFDEKIFLENISNQDWYRFKDNDLSMTYLDTQTLHDFSMSGTLFNIWNALRLTNYNLITVLEMMIEYLNFLQKNNKFFYEEYFFYIQKLEDLGFSSMIEKLHRGFTQIPKKFPILVFQDENFNYVFMDFIYYKIYKKTGSVNLEKLDANQLMKIPNSYSLQNLVDNMDR